MCVFCGMRGFAHDLMRLGVIMSVYMRVRASGMHNSKQALMKIVHAHAATTGRDAVEGTAIPADLCARLARAARLGVSSGHSKRSALHSCRHGPLFFGRHSGRTTGGAGGGRPRCRPAVDDAEHTRASRRRAHTVPEYGHGKPAAGGNDKPAHGSVPGPLCRAHLQMPRRVSVELPGCPRQYAKFHRTRGHDGHAVSGARGWGRMRA